MSMPFYPAWSSSNGTTLVAATEQNFPINPDNHTLRVVNTGGTNSLRFRTYNSKNTALPASAAAGGGMSLQPNAGSYIGYAQDHDRLSLFSTAGTTVEWITGDHGF